MSVRKVFIFIITLLIVSGCFIAWKLFGPTVNTPEGNYFYIRTGSSYESVKDSLLNKKIITGKMWFDKVAKYLHYDKRIRLGRYKIKENMNLLNLVRMLRAGTQSPVNLVITKLRTKEDLAKKIGDNFECDSTSVINFLNNPDSISKYKVDTNTVMTIVIPNTYTFYWNNAPSGILKKLFTEQKRFWTTKRKELASSLHLSAQQVFILASIVEEETNKNEDKGKIASVYLNRINKGMRMAADPTVKFAIRDFDLKRIYFKHLSYPSLYNTYLYAGLPPGPICTPSIKTIDAVLNSPKTDYIFFVAKPDFSGLSNFSSDYNQHLKNAKAYQQALDSIIKAKQQTM